MRPYATVSPQFWTGATGKRLRKNQDAQRVAFYLITSPHSHQTGVYYLPIMYLCHEIGMDQEGAYKALAWLESEDFCVYDKESEWVWIKGMAAWQVGSALSPADKRCRGIQQYIATLPELPFIDAFIEKYADDFHIKASAGRGLKGASSEQNRSEQEQEQNRADRASRLPSDFSLTPDRRLVAEAETLPAERTFEKFCDYWRAIPGAKGRKIDWDATWRNWCRNDKDARPVGAKKQRGVVC
jgi:hypothetical protein